MEGLNQLNQRTFTNGVTVSPKQIKAISHSYISDEAKAINKNLQDTDFANDGLCLMM